MLAWTFFGILALGTLAAAVMVVRAADLVRAVLWLAVTLLGTAGLYVTLDAGFLAAIQVLLYTGGVVTLMLFAVMLARRGAGAVPTGGTHDALRGAFAAGAVLALVGAGVARGTTSAPTPGTVDAKALGALVLGDLALPFEVLSMLLLAAMIGAIVLARRKDA